MKTSFGLTLILFLLFGCATKVDTQKEAKIIQNLENEWSAAITEKNIEMFLSFPSSDATFMDDNVPAYSGMENIRKATELWFADTSKLFNTYSFSIDKIEVAASGELAYAKGHSQMEVKSSIGTSLVKYKFIDIWKKNGDKWECILNIGNKDNPL